MCQVCEGAADAVSNTAMIDTEVYESEPDTPTSSQDATFSISEWIRESPVKARRIEGAVGERGRNVVANSGGISICMTFQVDGTVERKDGQLEEEGREEGHPEQELGKNVELDPSAPSFVPQQTVPQATQVVKQHFLGCSKPPQQDRTHDEGIMTFRGLVIVDGNNKVIGRFEEGSGYEPKPSTSGSGSDARDEEAVPEIRAGDHWSAW